MEPAIAGRQTFEIAHNRRVDIGPSAVTRFAGSKIEMADLGLMPHTLRYFSRESAERTAENSPAIHRWGTIAEANESVKRTAEWRATYILGGSTLESAVRFTDYAVISLPFPAVNCWAIFNRPLVADWDQSPGPSISLTLVLLEA